MASGPEHYRAAEELLQLVEETASATGGSAASVAATQAAHAHALLALAAATADPFAHQGRWAEVTR